MNEIIQWPLNFDSAKESDCGLGTAISDLEKHNGSVDAYGRLCHAVESLKLKIESGKGISKPLIDSSKESRIIPFTGKSRHDLFWEKVDKTPGHGRDGDCWVWTARMDGGGYGRFGIGGSKSTGAHRWSYMEANGEIPQGLLVCHRCDNTACVHPDHLFLGTHRDNMLDCSKKGRVALSFGENSGKSKLTNEQVKEMRRLYSQGESTSKLSDMYSMSVNQVGNVVSGRRRQSLGDDDPLCEMRSTKRFITHEGETLTLADWSRKLGIPANTISGRLEKMSFVHAITINNYDSLRKGIRDAIKEN